MFGWTELSRFFKKTLHFNSEISTSQYFSLLANALQCDLSAFLHLFGFELDNATEFTRWLDVRITNDLNLVAEIKEKN